VAFAGVATSGAGVFETPIGPVAIDREAVDSLVQTGLAREFEPAHKNEHSLEVQLPFLKHTFPDARIVPILAGDDDWQALARAMDLLWGGEETALVVSSDLSHYFDHGTAQRLDRATSEAIGALRPEDLGPEGVLIAAQILVDRDGHRKILLGSGGEMIKDIRQSAQRELKKLLQRPVRLELFVKVDEGWRDRPDRLDRLSI